MPFPRPDGRAPAFALVAALLAAGWWPMPAHAQEPWRFGGVSFPAVIDTFVCRATTRWPDNAGLGVALTYVVPGDQLSELTVYVYPVRAEDSVAARGDPTAERDRALNEVRSYALQTRQLDEFRVDTTGVRTLAVPGGGPLTGAFAALYFRLGEQRVRSLLYLFVSGGHYVKFRMSFDLSATGTLTPHAVAFMATALAAIRPEER